MSVKRPPRVPSAIGRGVLDPQVAHTGTGVAFQNDSHDDRAAAEGPAATSSNEGRPRAVSGQSADDDQSKSAQIYTSRTDQTLNSRIGRSQQLLLLPELSHFRETTLCTIFKSAQELSAFLGWCLEEEQTQWLESVNGPGTELAGVLEKLSAGTAPNAESSLVVQLICLLLEEYRAKGFLPDRSAAPALRDHGGVDVGRDMLTDTCSSRSSLRSFDSMECGKTSEVDDDAVDSIEPSLETTSTAPFPSMSTWSEGLFENLGAQFGGTEH